MAGAAAFGHIEMVKFLVSRGASLALALDAIGFSSVWSSDQWEQAALKILEVEKANASNVIIFYVIIYL